MMASPRAATQKGYENMKIAIGNDHVGIEMKKHVTKWLEDNGHEVVNFGTDEPASTDYPIYAERVAKAVVSGECDRGVLICGTGIGISLAANKVHGVRCALCTETVSAALARQHNNANIVAMGARTIGLVMAEEIVKTFMTTDFDGGRHTHRVEQIMALERGESVQ